MAARVFHHLCDLGLGDLKSEHAADSLASHVHFQHHLRGFLPTHAEEPLEHIHDDRAALSELARVLKPGGTFAATVPSYFPEKINWMLSDEYHAPFVSV